MRVYDDRAAQVCRGVIRLRHGHAGATPFPYPGGAKASLSGWSAPVRGLQALILTRNLDSPPRAAQSEPAGRPTGPGTRPLVDKPSRVYAD